MLDASGNLFIRQMGKADEKNGQITYMVVGVMRTAKQLPVDHGYTFFGEDLGESVRLTINTENGVDLKDKTRGLRADQILTSL